MTPTVLARYWALGTLGTKMGTDEGRLVDSFVTRNQKALKTMLKYVMPLEECLVPARWQQNP